MVLHGLLLDADGQKMSKSKGNGVDPLEVIDASGADALRFGMAYVSTGGQDIRWDPRRVEMGRNFTNKLWNASRFAFMNLEGEIDPGPPERLADRWITARLERAIETVTGHLEAFDLGATARAAYEFVWSEFCDWYLEAAKPALQEDDPRTRFVLRETLTAILKMLHPIVPFVTAELYEALGNDIEIGWAAWPEADTARTDPEAERAFGQLQAVVGAVRALRAEANLPPNQRVRVFVDGEGAAAALANADAVAALAGADVEGGAPEGAALTQAVRDAEVRLPFSGNVDLGEWRERQQKRLADLRADRGKSEKKLGNPKFVENAPEAVVDEERRRLAEAEDLIERIEASLQSVVDAQ